MQEVIQPRIYSLTLMSRKSRLKVLGFLGSIVFSIAKNLLCNREVCDDKDVFAIVESVVLRNNEGVYLWMRTELESRC